MDATRLILVRHAEVSTGDRLCGWYDVPLSAQGTAQLASLNARAAVSEPPVALYTSTLLRARSTADVLSAMWRMPPRPAEALREINCGQLDGVLIRDVQARWPDLWTRNLAQDDEAFRWPGGESYREFRARIMQALAAIAEWHRRSRVVIVTHAGVISQVVGAADGQSPACWSAHRPAPTSATEVLWDGAGPNVLRFNDSRAL